MWPTFPTQAYSLSRPLVKRCTIEDERLYAIVKTWHTNGLIAPICEQSTTAFGILCVFSLARKRSFFWAKQLRKERPTLARHSSYISWKHTKISQISVCTTMNSSWSERFTKLCSTFRHTAEKFQRQVDLIFILFVIGSSHRSASEAGCDHRFVERGKQSDEQPAP